MGIFLKTDRYIHRFELALFSAAFGFLLAGILIYGLCRDSNLLVFGIIGKPSFWGQFRLIYPSGNLPLNVLAYNVPDGLWMLSGLLCLRALWLDNESKGKIYIRVFFVLAFLFEGLQWFDWIPGTFDVCDLIVYAIAPFVEGIFYYCFVKRKKENLL